MTTDTDAMTDRADEGTPREIVEAAIEASRHCEAVRRAGGNVVHLDRIGIIARQNSDAIIVALADERALLVEKVARLERLVEQAFREGLNDAPNSSLRYNEDLTPFWLSSAARTALNASREGGGE